MVDVIPQNMDAFLRALGSWGALIEDIPVDIVRIIHDPWRCPAPLLPWLAWHRRVPDWAPGLTEDQQRERIASAPKKHRHMGSPDAVLWGLETAGFAGAEVEEGMPVPLRNGEFRRDGSLMRDGADRWALFRVKVDIGVKRGLDASSVADVRDAVEVTKNLRSRLHSVRFVANVAVGDPGSAEEAPAQLRLLADGLERKGVRDGRIQRGSALPLVRNGHAQRDGKRYHNGHLSYVAGGGSGPLILRGRFPDGPDDPPSGHLYDVAPVHLRPTMTMDRRAPVMRDGTSRRDGQTLHGPFEPSETMDLKAHRTLRRDGSERRDGFGGPARDGQTLRDGSRVRGTPWRRQAMEVPI